MSNNNFTFEESIISEEGRKGFMEDTFCFFRLSDNPPRIFGGVYDGHKGGFASSYAKDRLHKLFFNEFEKGVSAQDAFKYAYEEASLEMSGQNSGTTATNFYIDKNVIHWASVGDGHLVIFGDGGIKQLTEAHRVDNPKEKERVLAHGGDIRDGFVVKQGGVIEPTRALGDGYFRDVGIISTPDTGKYAIAVDDRWILAGTDGVFDFVTNKRIREALNSHSSAQKAAYALKEEVLARAMGTDNTTFILIKIKKQNS